MGKGGGGGGASGSAMSAASELFAMSNPARRQMFKQLASALTTGGGKGFKSGVVQQAVMRSREAGQVAMRSAGSTLPTSMGPDIRGRVLNRIAREGKRETAAIGPGFAQQLIAQAPAALTGSSEEQNRGYSVVAQGQAAALQAAATRAAGWGSALQSVAGSAGTAIGGLSAEDKEALGKKIGGAARAPIDWYKRFFGSGASDSGAK